MNQLYFDGLEYLPASGKVTTWIDFCIMSVLFPIGSNNQRDQTMRRPLQSRGMDDQSDHRKILVCSRG